MEPVSRNVGAEQCPACRTNAPSLSAEGQPLSPVPGWKEVVGTAQSPSPCRWSISSPLLRNGDGWRETDGLISAIIEISVAHT